MTYYTLYNKQSQKRLIHPRIGLWNTSDLLEAREMLVACHEHLTASHIPIHEQIVIIDVETGEEV